MSQEFFQGSSSERFWLEEPVSLFRSTTLIPQCGMTTAARLNALTRLVLLIALILYLFCIGQWWLFLLLGLLLVIVLYYLDQQSQNRYNGVVVENYVCPTRQVHRYPVYTKPVYSTPQRHVGGFQPYI